MPSKYPKNVVAGIATYPKGFPWFQQTLNINSKNMSNLAGAREPCLDSRFSPWRGGEEEGQRRREEVHGRAREAAAQGQEPRRRDARAVHGREREHLSPLRVPAAQQSCCVRQPAINSSLYSLHSAKMQTSKVHI